MADLSEEFSEFEIEALNAHNELRELHGAPPLTLSRELCSYAEEWATHLAETNSLTHRPTRDYGENLYAKWGTGFEVTGRTAVQNWYDEIKDYDFSNPGFSSGTGHFTQVVWASTTEMGIALVQEGNGYFVVANYSPNGNMAGEYEGNVLPNDN